jgi:hypothetical protein
MQDGRMKVMNMAWRCRDLGSSLIGRTINKASFDASTGKPTSKRFAMVISPVLALSFGCPPKFGTLIEVNKFIAE